MRIRIGWLLIFILVTLSGNSQDIPGSVYSAAGFGDLHERSSAYTRALGNTSIAVRNDFNINATNPAALTSLIAPVASFFEIGAHYGSTYTNTISTANSSKYGGLTGINYWFRHSKKWGSLVGVSPLSSVSYSVVSPRVLGGNSSIQVQSQGSGGINQFYFGNAYDVLKNLSLGVNVSFYLGSVKKSNIVPATSVSNLFEVEKQLTASGANVDFGLQYTLAIKKTKIIFGAVWDKGASLSGSTQTAIVNPITFDTLRKTDKAVLRSRLPPNYGVGIGFKRFRSTFAFDARYQEWKKAAFDEDQTYRNSIKYSAGYEYRGDFSSFNYLKTISIRGGAWVQNFPMVVQGTNLTTWGYTFGIALPIQGNRANVALNYSFTQLGVAQAELVREQSRKLSLDIIVRDVWGPKRKFD